MKTKYLLHMLLLGRSGGAAVHTVRLSQEYSQDRNSEETWSLSRLILPLQQLLAGCPAKSTVQLFSLEDFTLHSSFDRLFQETAFLMCEVSQLKEACCPKHNAVPQRESCCISLPCLHSAILSGSSVFSKLLIFTEQRGTFTGSAGLLLQLLSHRS